MLNTLAINNESFALLEPLYYAYCEIAKTNYGLEHEPVDFETLKKAFAQKVFRGFISVESTTGLGTAFMLYVEEEHRALEINVMYVPDSTTIKSTTDALMQALIAAEKENPAFDVVSFPMMGDHAELIRTLMWYGFKPVGQAIVSFNIMDAISLQIMKAQAQDPLPEGYELISWKPELAGDVSECVFRAFEQSTDAKWDPRFTTLMGAKKAVSTITNNIMGQHIQDCTAVLLFNGKPIGFCFIIQASMTHGNIPLIGVDPEHKKKGFGIYLLQYSLAKVVDSILAGKIGMLEVNATHDTDNIPAIKMYRRLGFRESAHYPHAYMTKEKMQSYVKGLWC